MRRILDLSIAVIFGIIIGGLIFWIASPPRGKPIELKPVPNSNEMVVYITGAVMNPGVYTLPENSRLINAVTSAGGLKAEADAEIINQAAPLQDGARIYIPRIGEENITLNRSSEIIISDDCPTSVSNDGMQIEIININTAGQEELEKLPGIGPEKAQAIIQYRTEISRFNKIEEIMLVPGIGSKLFEDSKDMITVD